MNKSWRCFSNALLIRVKKIVFTFNEFICRLCCLWWQSGDCDFVFLEKIDNDDDDDDDNVDPGYADHYKHVFHNCLCRNVIDNEKILLRYAHFMTSKKRKIILKLKLKKII